MNDRCYVILKFNSSSNIPGKVVIQATNLDHIWGSPVYEVIDYADTYREAQKIARQTRGKPNNG